MRLPTGWPSARGSGSRSIARAGAAGCSTTPNVPSVAANGLTLEYESLGDPANPPLLLVMGLGANMRLWPPALCDKLVAAGFHVIRFDNRDAGRSTQLDHLGVPNIAKEAVKFMLRMKV